MNSSYLKRIGLFSLIIVVVTGLILNYSFFSTNETAKQCQIDLKQECSLSYAGQQISVRFLQDIEVEEEIELTIKVPNDSKIIEMWVQGVNMYMGKHTVLIDSVFERNTQNVYEARLFLGSCSEPQMRWQLIIRTETETQSKEAWFFNFSTDVSKS